jgi:TRAP-type mannitol/chloroaromatic compound transport system substrate-binding protein
MKRRTFLKAGAVTGASAVAAPAIAQGKRELKMALAWPLNYPGYGTSAQILAKKITEATNGRLTVTPYAANDLVPVAQMFDAVADGRVDMYHAIEYYWEDKDPAFNFFAGVPFGLSPIEMDTWLNKYGGQELWDELSARYNIKPLAAGNTGVQMGGWFNKRIQSEADLRGLRIRITGLAAEVYQSFGAEPVVVPGGRVVEALNSGEIDAAEWVGPWNDMALGLHRAARYYYHPGFHEPGTQISVGMNLDLWIGLSEGEKELIKMACRTEAVRMLAEFNARNAAAITQLVRAGNTEILGFPDDLLNEMGKASSAVAMRLADSSDHAQRIFQNFVSARYQLLRWTKVAEDAFLLARRLPFDYDRSEALGIDRDLSPGQDGNGQQLLRQGAREVPGETRSSIGAEPQIIDVQPE